MKKNKKSIIVEIIMRGIYYYWINIIIDCSSRFKASISHAFQLFTQFALVFVQLLVCAQIFQILWILWFLWCFGYFGDDGVLLLTTGPHYKGFVAWLCFKKLNGKFFSFENVGWENIFIEMTEKMSAQESRKPRKAF